MAGQEGSADARLAAAHRALRSNGDIQFDLPSAAPPKPPQMPEWLQAIGRWIADALRPLARLIRWISGHLPQPQLVEALLWGMIALLALFALWMAFVRLREGEWRLPRLRRRNMASPASIDAPDPDADWTPDAAPAREWLREADALAERGQYGEAVHHLLLRSVEDIAERRPHLVRPALTSRDLARATAIPERPRHLFATLAAVVERSLFGGRAVDGETWTRCRAAYADFVQVRSWQR